MFRLEEVKRILINRRHVHIEKKWNGRYWSEYRMEISASTSVRISTSPLRGVSTKYLLCFFFFVRNSKRNILFSQCRPLSGGTVADLYHTRLLGSWYNFMMMVDWFWNENFQKDKLQIVHVFFFGCCCCDLFVLSTVARLLHGFDSRCIQCVFGWYQRQSMDGTLNALRGPFTSVGRFVALQNNNNNVSLCWVDSKKKNFTSCLYIMMCSFWHRYTFMFIQ